MMQNDNKNTKTMINKMKIMIMMMITLEQCERELLSCSGKTEAMHKPQKEAGWEPPIICYEDIVNYVFLMLWVSLKQIKLPDY